MAKLLIHGEGGNTPTPMCMFGGKDNEDDGDNHDDDATTTGDIFRSSKNEFNTGCREVR